VVHVLDASRCVGVVERLLSDDLRDAFVAENAKLQRELAESYERRQVTLAPYVEACAHPAAIDWASSAVDRPEWLGTRTLDVPLEELVPFIDWSPLFMAWELKGKYPRIFADSHVGEQAKELFADAQRLLRRIIDERLLTARAIYGFWPANSEGDDVVVYRDETRSVEAARFHMLRQQWRRAGQTEFRSLADYVAPRESGRVDYLGAFAVTAGFGCDELSQRYLAEHDDYHSIMTKALADRLAEAFAEWLHRRARIEWGYGRDERLSNEELIEEKYRGIRPAHGYPACPDHTEKRTLFDLLDVERQIGVTLTESFAMWPAASVSGLYFAHPQARYFAVDRLGRDQVEDYARRKGWSMTTAERWLAPNLGYDPVG